MRILQMSRWFFPHVGGASVRVYQIAKNLSESGHEVHLLTHNPMSIEQCNLDEGAKLYEKHQDGFYVYRLPYFKSPIAEKQLNWMISIPLMAKRAIEIIKREKIDVILSENPPYLIGASSLIASKVTGIPLVIDIHDVWGATHYGFFNYHFGNFLQDLCIRETKNFAVVSEGLRDIVAKRFNIPLESIYVAPNAINLDSFKVDKTQSEIVSARYKKKGIQEDDQYVFFIGIMRKWAGVDYLIRAFAKVLEENKSNDRLKLLLVGGGGDKEEFEKLAKDLGIRERVIFADSVPYSDAPYLISLATIACAPFPSSNVTDQDKLISPIKVLEYMAAGKPIIASSVGGMERYVIDGKTGLLAKPGDPEDLARKIVYLLNERNKRKLLGKNAYEYIKSGGFEWSDSAKIIEKTLVMAIQEVA